MRPQKILDSDMLEGLTKVFRSKGYDGSNLSDLAKATDLKKASLYHRFPNGKQEMAEAVLTHMGKWVEQQIFEPLKNENFSPKERLKKALSGINLSYNGGNDTCIFRALTLESGIQLFQKQIKNGMEQWINEFENFGLLLGLSKDEAKTLAIQNLIDIQGSLVVSKGLNKTKVFENTLIKIEKRYFTD